METNKVRDNVHSYEDILRSREIFEEREKEDK